MISERIISVEGLNDRSAGRALIVVPTYNERQDIRAFIEAIGLRSEADLLIVDDGSPDGTAEAAKIAASSAPMRVLLMRRPRKLGLGTAYTDAFRWILRHETGYDVVVSMDADFSHGPEKVPALTAMARESGFAIGSRYVSGGACRDWPLHRRLLSRWANLYASAIIRLRHPRFRIHDATSGFAAWSRNALERVMAADPKSDGYAFAVETKLAAVLAGYVPKELPITFKDRTHGTSKISKAVILESALLPWRILLRR